MECVDSNVSTNKTSKNKVSAAGAEKVSKNISESLPIRAFSLYKNSSYSVTFLCDILR